MTENNLKIEAHGFLYLAMCDALNVKKELGLIAFSQLVHHFLEGLHECKTPYSAIEFYQYQGDGVLFEWSKLEHSEQAVAFIQDFLAKMKEEEASFEAKFGLIPSFHIGFHIGDVIQGGNDQHKIFFGEAIDQTCKLQSLCNHYEQPMLFSESMEAHCPNLKLNYVRRVYLKGSTEAMDLFEL